MFPLNSPRNPVWFGSGLASAVGVGSALLVGKTMTAHCRGVCLKSEHVLNTGAPFLCDTLSKPQPCHPTLIHCPIAADHSTNGGCVTLSPCVPVSVRPRFKKFSKSCFQHGYLGENGGKTPDFRFWGPQPVSASYHRELDFRASHCIGMCAES